MRLLKSRPWDVEKSPSESKVKVPGDDEFGVSGNGQINVMSVLGVAGEIKDVRHFRNHCCHLD
jgi:hypothetical protein